MPLRSECLYQDQIIGIESIYTVVNGKQINIPGRVEELRRLGREGKLFCPCGCGANLIVVAGEKNLRTQHFRAMSGHDELLCTVKKEDLIALTSKMVLKLWLDQVSGEPCLGRVPLNKICSTDRRFEFSFLSEKIKTGICYWRHSPNISSTKIDSIQRNYEAYHAIYITDIGNRPESEQYPEYIMKTQNAQGYALFLDVNRCELGRDDIMSQAELEARGNVRNYMGEWEDIPVIRGPLPSFTISAGGELEHGGSSVYDLAVSAERKYEARQEEFRRKLQEQEEKRKQEELSAAEQTRRSIEEHKAYFEEQARLKALEEEEAERKLEALLRDSIHKKVEENMEVVVGLHDRRWLKCKYCGKIASEESFCSYGGADGPARGTCYDCRDKEPLARVTPLKPAVTKPGEGFCSNCGGMLKRRIGRYGEFLGCSNYPKCRFTAPCTEVRGKK